MWQSSLSKEQKFATLEMPILWQLCALKALD
jgi:hypothetical protein